MINEQFKFNTFEMVKFLKVKTIIWMSEGTFYRKDQDQGHQFLNSTKILNVTNTWFMFDGKIPNDSEVIIVHKESQRQR